MLRFSMRCGNAEQAQVETPNATWFFEFRFWRAGLRPCLDGPAAHEVSRKPAFLPVLFYQWFAAGFQWCESASADSGNPDLPRISRVLRYGAPGESPKPCPHNQNQVALRSRRAV